MTEDEKAACGRPAGAPANDSGEAADEEVVVEGDETAVATPEEQLAAVETELAETKDRLLRALAETENTRRRLQREREDAQKYAVAGFARDLLSAVDNLRRALDAVPEPEVKHAVTRSLLDGVAATERELMAALERHGVKRIDPLGERFDHNLHQAIFETERSDVAIGTVVEVLQPGYVLYDRLLRPAMVGVAKGGAAPATPEGDADA